MLRTLSATLVLLLAAQAANAADLRVKVDGLTTANGPIIASLISSADAWEGRAASVADRVVQPASTDAIELVFEGIEPGEYAIRVMHDENNNGELDRTDVGMPTEGYGFSNNPQVMRAATFAEARFIVAESGTLIHVQLR